MSRIGKATDGGKKNATLDELEAEFNSVINEIRAKLKGRTDLTAIPREEKQSLRADYSRAASIAKTISERAVDSEKSQKYKKNYEDLSDIAIKRLGSVMRREIPQTTFDDVKGLDNVKELVKTFVFMAQHPDIVKYYKMEGGLGLLMYGAPGTGKTKIAEAIAHELQLPLLTVTPADIFKSYVGESEQSVKLIFEELDACEDGAILFIDECESIFARRTNDTKDYKAAVTNELLQRINGLGVDGSKRIMIGATNRPDMIDPAYLRYKRFSHLVHVTPPDAEAKRAIIESKLNGIELEEGFTVNDIFDMTESCTAVDTPLGTVYQKSAYYSAADICGIVEEACRLALTQLIEKGAETAIPLTREMFEKAFAKIPPSISAELLKSYEEFHP